MVVRIHWNKRRTTSEYVLRNPALAVASLLTPLALIAFTITLWCLGAELRVTSRFFISSGLFSHWQVWLITGGTLSVSAWLLNRYAGRAERSNYNRHSAQQD